MEKIEDATKLLKLMRTKPALFWDNGDHHFTSLVAFIAGYKLGCGCPPESATAPEKLVPTEFHSFVAKKLREENPGGIGWSGLIRQNTGGEEEAFQLFFKLRSEFESERERAT